MSGIRAVSPLPRLFSRLNWQWEIGGLEGSAAWAAAKEHAPEVFMIHLGWTHFHCYREEASAMVAVMQSGDTKALASWLSAKLAATAAKASEMAITMDRHADGLT